MFDKGRPWDLTVNAEFSETKYGQAVAGNEPHTAESKSVLVGLTTPEIYKPKFGTISLTLLAGIESVESELRVANNTVIGGVETVSDDYNSMYLVAGSKWFSTMSKDKVAHDVALGVDLIHERTASHDASAHFTMHERNLTQLNASASYQLSIASSGKSSIYGGGEVNYAKLIQGEDQEFTIKGETTNTKLTHTDDKESESYYKGVLVLALKPSEISYFYVSAQMLNSNVDIDGYGVSLGFKTTK